jgi:hypothetical protein
MSYGSWLLKHTFPPLSHDAVWHWSIARTPASGHLDTEWEEQIKIRRTQGFQALLSSYPADAAVQPYVNLWHIKFFILQLGYIHKVSRFCTTQSRLDSVNVADENQTYKTGLWKYLKEGHTGVNKYKIRKNDFVKVPVLKVEKKERVEIKSSKHS